MELGQLVAALRRRRGLSQEAASAAVGKGRSYFAAIESGRRGLPPDVQQKVSEVLELSDDERAELKRAHDAWSGVAAQASVAEAVSVLEAVGDDPALVARLDRVESMLAEVLRRLPPAD